MKRGRKPQPRAQKELHGTLEKSRAKHEPEAPSGALQPSTFIERQPYALEIWNQMLSTAPLGLLKPIDLQLFERLVIALARAKEADEQVLRLGMMIQVGVRKDSSGQITDPGSPAQNPFLAIVNRQTDIARKLASELGLPVTARARIDMPDAPMPQQPSTGRSKSGFQRPRSLDAFLATKPSSEELPN